MSFYNMMFGMNPNSDSILALLGFKKNDVERFRDCSIDIKDKIISIYTRTGGGNRDDYPNELLTSHTCYKHDEDDDFDSTYATYYFGFPQDIAEDILKWCNWQENGIPAVIIKRINDTVNRPETESDKYAREYKEQSLIAKELIATGSATTWNGHTIVPLSDSGMAKLLEATEKYGKFSAYSIMPFKPDIKLDSCKWSFESNKPDIEQDKEMVVIGTPRKWIIDDIWWARWEQKFSAKYPAGIAHIAKEVEEYKNRESTIV